MTAGPGDPSGTTPRQRIRSEAARTGRPAFVAACVRLLREGDPVEDVPLLRVLGGPHADALLRRGLPPDQLYWTRVWALRGLLWVWEDAAVDAVDAVDAEDAVATTFEDSAWRVREMAAKVVARHLVGALLGAVAPLRADPVPRVRRAADRAVARLTAARA